MFCANCGEQIEDDATVCPYCDEKVGIEDLKAKTKQIEENQEDKDKRFFKELFKQHPVRFCLCVPVWLFILFAILGLSIDDWFYSIMQAIGLVLLGNVISWCLYGPINYREVRRIVEQKEIKHLGVVRFAICFFLALMLISCEADEEDLQLENEIQETVVDEEENESDETEYELSMEDYLKSCEMVSLEELARKPEKYVGKDIIVEGKLNITFGVISIGLWSTNTPMTVEYAGKVYDMDLNEVGNLINGDYGYVAGKFAADEEIIAEIIILKNK